MGSLPEEDRDALRTRGRIRYYGEGEVLFRQWDRRQDVLVVLQGTVKEVGSSPSGNWVLLGIKGLGDLVGHLAMMDGLSQHVTAVTATHCSVLSISAPRFQEFLDSHRESERSLRNYLAGELREATQLRIDLTGSPASIKVARVLYWLADNYGIETSQGVKIGVPLAQSELAGLAGVSVRAAEEALADLRRRSIISTSYRHISLRSLVALDRYMSS